MNYLKFLKAWLKYLPMNLSLPGLVQWEPLANPQPGYSVVIGCMNNMPAIAIANVAFISRMKLPNMYRLILVFDVEASKISDKEAILEAAKNLPVQILGYSPKQAAVARFFSWGWIYAWLSWSKGIAAAETQYVLLHDLDAMPTDPDLFETLYAPMQTGNSMFQGIQHYVNQDFTVQDGLVRTFEMLVDIKKLRREFQPFDAFNKVKFVAGKLIIYDTFLYIQSQAKSYQLETINSESSLVHPTQLISQYTDLLSNRVTKGFWGKYANLPLFPIYSFLGNSPELLRSITRYIKEKKNPNLPFMNKQVNFSGIPARHWLWLWQQARTLQTAYYGTCNPDIEEYITLLNSTYNPQASIKE
ncbi:MAG: hypothetical protein ACTS3T_18670 [Almyronema sp.]